MPWPVLINGRFYQASDFAPYNYVNGLPNLAADMAAVGDAANAIVSAGTYGNSFRNRLRNASFLINQRGVSGTVTLAAGQYGHDGFKAGGAGCTYTFSRSSGITWITITAGTLIQVIEGALYLPESGPYTVSWLGTAQAQVNSTPYQPSPITVNGLIPDANATVEWSTGTLALPMFEPGSKRTVFERRDDELRRCLRYWQPSNAAIANLWTSGLINAAFVYSTPMRANPSVSVLNGTNVVDRPGVASYNITGVSSVFAPGAQGACIQLSTNGTSVGICEVYPGALAFNAEIP